MVDGVLLLLNLILIPLCKQSFSLVKMLLYFFMICLEDIVNMNAILKCHEPHDEINLLSSFGQSWWCVFTTLILLILNNMLDILKPMLEKYILYIIISQKLPFN